MILAMFSSSDNFSLGRTNFKATSAVPALPINTGLIKVPLKMDAIPPLPIFPSILKSSSFTIFINPGTETSNTMVVFNRVPSESGIQEGADKENLEPDMLLSP
eukprot:Lithocolla_globosa_v1_NODE_1337_length_2661_cov_7.138526.p2 type:complete len:103 gc:universal NODE_1337_length_2661_cov_7.138526:1945-1637(-)